MTATKKEKLMPEAQKGEIAAIRLDSGRRKTGQVQLMQWNVRWSRMEKVKNRILKYSTKKLETVRGEGKTMSNLVR